MRHGDGPTVFEAERPPDARRLPLDEVNQQLLHILVQRGRTTLCELAAAVGRSESSVRERVAALERRGVVTGYEARIDWAQAGLPLVAVVEGYCPPARTAEIAGRLGRVPNLVDAVLTTGLPNVVAIVRARDMHDVRKNLAWLASSGLRDIGVRVTIERFVAERQPVGLLGQRHEQAARDARPPPLPAVTTVAAGNTR